ncbi:MAG: response regulator [Anaerolineae bacterium]
MASPRILVVDDDPDFVEITRTVLQAHGFEVVTASGGRQAIEAMRREAPAAVVLDVMMDGATDGYQVSQVMHEDPELTKIPVLMLSSIMDTPLAGQFPTDEYLPVVEFMRKPVNPKELADRVRALVGG